MDNSLLQRGVLYYASCCGCNTRPSDQYSYSITGTVLPVQYYIYRYQVTGMITQYSLQYRITGTGWYQYYCPIYRYSFISTAVSNHSYD